MRKYKSKSLTKICETLLIRNSGVPRIFENGGAYDHNQICLVEKLI